jgi:hypothetical protein
MLRAIRLGQRTPIEVLSTLKSIPEQSTLHLEDSLLQKIINQVINEKM